MYNVINKCHGICLIGNIRGGFGEWAGEWESGCRGANETCER